MKELAHLLFSHGGFLILVLISELVNTVSIFSLTPGSAYYYQSSSSVEWISQDVTQIGAKIWKKS